MPKKSDTITEDVIKKYLEHLKNPNTTLTGDKLKEMKRKISESLSVDRQKLVCRQPFTGGMLMHFELVPVRSYLLDTASTDGSRIFFDMDFYTTLNEDERMFVLAHECWHCIYLHFLRRQGREKELWNIATDCEINYMLKTQDFVSPQNLCYPSECDYGKSAEEIYEHLLKNMKKNNGNGNDDGNSYGSSDGNKDKNKKRSGKGLNGQFDKHTDKDSDDEDNGNGNMLPSDKWGEKGDDPDYRPRISSDVSERVREHVISEAQKYERLKGSLPGSIEQILKKFRNPEISWKEILSQEVTKCYSDHREWLPPNRRYVYQGLYLQSNRGSRMKCTVMIDTSGSTTADLPKFMGELVGLLNSFSNYEMKVIQCDSEVQSVEKYDECNPFPVEDCSKVKFSGFGGSNLIPAFEYLEKEDEDEYPNIIIVFTDGYIDVPKNPPPATVLWVLTNDGNVNLCDYGRKLVFKEKRAED